MEIGATTLNVISNERHQFGGFAGECCRIPKFRSLCEMYCETNLIRGPFGIGSGHFRHGNRFQPITRDVEPVVPSAVGKEFCREFDLDRLITEIMALQGKRERQR